MGVRVVDLASAAFRAMGTDVHLLVLDGADSDLHWARAEVEHAEERWSRFRAQSDVTRLSQAAGGWIRVAPETVDLLHAVRQAQASTGGAFDPLLGRPLVALGYDRSFEAVDQQCSGLVAPEEWAIPPEGIEINDDALMARLPEGTSLDLGGIAKGWTADRLVAGLVQRGARGACANLGGDLAVAGDAPDPAGWVIEVDRRGRSVPADLVALRTGGLATSTTQRRAWLGPGGDRRHHLLDPASGRPCSGPLVEVTVIATSAAAAEVLTKVAFVTPDQLDGALRAASAVALLTLANGEVIERGDPAQVDDVLIGRADAG